MPDPTLAQQRLLEKYFADSIKHHSDWPVILTEGDSWFSYPGHWNTIDHFDDLLNYEISLLRLEQSGDTLMRMTSGRERGLLRKLLDLYPIDFLLFSGGGNDVVGHELIDFFDDVPPGKKWRDYLREDAVDNQFAQIEAAYHSIAYLRDQYRPGCTIITHGYGYAQPSGLPTKFWLWPIPVNVVVGPWIKNNLSARGITKATAQDEVVHYLIDRFNDLLQDVASHHDDFIALDLRGDLTKKDWSDELHPTRAAFRRIAQRFVDALVANQ